MSIALKLKEFNFVMQVNHYTFCVVGKKNSRLTKNRQRNYVMNSNTK